jgi:hypothetical protein
LYDLGKYSGSPEHCITPEVTHQNKPPKNRIIPVFTSLFLSGNLCIAQNLIL